MFQTVNLRYYSDFHDEKQLMTIFEFNSYVDFMIEGSFRIAELNKDIDGGEIY